MRIISVEDVEPGQVLGKTIFSSNGQVLLNENVQLTVYMINTLKRIGVTMLYVKDAGLEDVEIEDVVSEETKRAVAKKMGEMFEAARSGKQFNTRSVSTSVNSLLDEIVKNQDVLVQLTDIRSEDNAQYIHAMNVCILSVMVGINMDLAPSQLKDLAIGALLHDVGKVGIDPEAEKRDMKRHHTWRGFETLKREFNLMTAHIALQHHETPDGEGIPRALPGDQINLMAKIVGCCNIYDNLLYDLSDGKRMLPHEACERLMALSGTKVDTEVLFQFLRIVSIYPTGTSVRLSTKETGVVVGQHRGLPGRPIVRIVNRDDNENIEVKEVDLAKETTVFIEGVLS